MLVDWYDVGPVMVMMKKRPLAVAIIGWVYIVMNTVGFVYHAREFTLHPFTFGVLGIEVVRVLGFVAGVWMLRGANWARWLALAWMAFHVGISYLNGWDKVVTHAVFLGVIAFFLLRGSANEYFVDNYPTPPKQG
jgi:hypothetical protein